MNRAQKKFLEQNIDRFIAQGRREHGTKWEHAVDGMSDAAEYRAAADRGDVQLKQSTIETREVLAGAYLRSDDRRTFLSHAVEIDKQGREQRVLCGRVKVESICDASAAPESIHSTPTCAVCAKRDPRRTTK